jgi:hypothetical protein
VLGQQRAWLKGVARYGIPPRLVPALHGRRLKSWQTVPIGPIRNVLPLLFARSQPMSIGSVTRYSGS